MLIVLSCIAVFFLLCRFVPGPKCVTYCVYNNKKAKEALDSITTSNGNLSLIAINSKTTKELVSILKLIENTSCRSFSCDTKIISQLREAIAERQILGIR